MSFEFESLELRQLLSVSLAPAAIPMDAPPAVHVAKAAKARLVGNYGGTIKSTAHGSVKMVMKVTKQTAKGGFSGTLRSTDGRVSMSFTGLLASNNTFKMTFSGRDEDGPLTGKGTGKFTGRGFTGKYLTYKRGELADDGTFAVSR